MGVITVLVAIALALAIGAIVCLFIQEAAMNELRRELYNETERSRTSYYALENLADTLGYEITSSKHVQVDKAAYPHALRPRVEKHSEELESVRDACRALRRNHQKLMTHLNLTEVTYPESTRIEKIKKTK